MSAVLGQKGRESGLTAVSQVTAARAEEKHRIADTSVPRARAFHPVPGFLFQMDSGQNTPAPSASRTTDGGRVHSSIHGPRLRPRPLHPQTPFITHGFKDQHTAVSSDPTMLCAHTSVCPTALASDLGRQVLNETPGTQPHLSMDISSRPHGLKAERTRCVTCTERIRTSAP